MAMFERTLKFVRDTQFLCNVILSPEYYDKNGIFHAQAMSKYEAYCVIDEDSLMSEVNGSPIQASFDDFKRLLNKIDIPDYDTASISLQIRDMTSDTDLIEDAISIFETIVEKCGNLRNSLTSWMELYDLRDNSPRKGFLRPLYFDEDAQLEDDTYTPSTEDDEPSLWCLENKESYTRFSLQDINYTKLHKLLTDENLGVVNKEITKDYIIDVVQRAQFGRIYQHCDTKRSKFRMIVSRLANRTANKEVKKEYLNCAANSMGIDKEDVGKYNVKDNTFIKKLSEIF